ncbi:hypothetical protein M5K25_015066 [Dendrobium thyrsiflorum]|uniref:Uncharacterized protein n=1 Tax=Dendrobium thyrsiflorum TaxID=117978 RepID=A0ABD0UW69_DENTH
MGFVEDLTRYKAEGASVCVFYFVHFERPSSFVQLSNERRATGQGSTIVSDNCPRRRLLLSVTGAHNCFSVNISSMASVIVVLIWTVMYLVLIACATVSLMAKSLIRVPRSYTQSELSSSHKSPLRGNSVGNGFAPRTVDVGMATKANAGTKTTMDVGIVEMVDPRMLGTVSHGRSNQEITFRNQRQRHAEKSSRKKEENDIPFKVATSSAYYNMIYLIEANGRRLKPP